MRLWIRLSTVLLLLGVVLEQADIVRRVASGEMAHAQLRDGYIFLLVLLVLVWRTVFHPRVVLNGGQIEVRNPLRTHRFAVAELVTFEETPYGLRFLLRDGDRPLTLIFQATRYVHQPRWYELAEMVTGRRPSPGPNQLSRPFRRSARQR